MGKRIINNEGDKRAVIEFLQSFNIDEPLQVEIKPYKPKRKLSQNNLYWSWLTTLAKHFSKKAPPYHAEQMHDLMRHKFLGYENQIIGSTEIKGQLISTASLESPAMSEYMTKIEAWAADMGCLLPVLACKEYENYREAQQ